MRSVFKSYFVLLAITLGIRLLDVAKNLLVASKIGVSGYADVYNSLQALPDNFVILLGIDTIKGVANSEFSSLYSTGKNGELKRSMNLLLKYLTIISVILTVSVVLLRSTIIKLALPGLSDPIYLLSLQISVFIFPAFFVRSVSSLLMPYYNSRKKFYFPVITQSLIAVCIIVSVYLPFVDNRIIVNLSVAFLVGNILYFISNAIPVLRDVGIGEIMDFKLDKVSKIILIGCSAIFVNSLMNQLYQSSRNFFVSYFPEGSISALTYGTTIPGFVGTLTFTIVFGVLLTNLSSLLSTGKISEAKKLFFDTLNILYFVYIPIVITFLLISENILSLVFLRGNFDIKGIRLSQLPFRWESLTLLPFLAYIIPTSLLLAMRNYKYLTIAGLFAFGSGIFINLFITKFVGFYGVSIGAFIFSIIYGTILFLEVKKIFGDINIELFVIAKLVFSGFITLVLMYISIFLMDLKFENYGFIENSFVIVVVWSIVYSVFIAITYLFVPKFVKYAINMALEKIKRKG